jgi:predicted GNAT family acetyltransferase
MLALANLTKPGPFFERTHRLGDFIGVKVPDGKGGRRLAAMAGERMRLPGFTEVSGICTHPDYRGHGYAGGLSRIVAGRILARGETPFLHAYAHNTAATGLYETLGFSLRRQMHMRVLTRA